MAGGKDIHLPHAIGQPASGHLLSVLAALFNSCLAVWVALPNPSGYCLAALPCCLGSHWQALWGYRLVPSACCSGYHWQSLWGYCLVSLALLLEFPLSNPAIVTTLQPLLLLCVAAGNRCCRSRLVASAFLLGCRWQPLLACEARQFLGCADFGTSPYYYPNPLEGFTPKVLVRHLPHWL